MAVRAICEVKAILDVNMFKWRLELSYQLSLSVLYPRARAVIVAHEKMRRSLTGKSRLAISKIGPQSASPSSFIASKRKSANAVANLGRKCTSGPNADSIARIKDSLTAISGSFARA
jgi:hypothetical protein